MSLLEEKIKKNRDNLDAAEPGQGHLERFEKRLSLLHEGKKETRRSGYGRLWKVAAVILVLIGVSLTLYFISPGEYNNHLAANALPREIQEAKMYYELETVKKLDEVQQCAASPDQADLIRQIAQQELVALDSSSQQLEEQLKQDAGNERLKNALILNYKTKADLIEDIIKKVCKL